MGQSHSSPGKKSKKKVTTKETLPSSMSPSRAAAATGLINLQNKCCKSVQDQKYQRMREEFENDVQEFVLNNLLLSVELFDDFER